MDVYKQVSLFIYSEWKLSSHDPNRYTSAFKEWFWQEKTFLQGTLGIIYEYFCMFAPMNNKA